jgi:hypothetical protein
LTLDTHRLLGFAFASADLLVEIDATGEIAFAIGASEALSGSREASLVGRRWSDFVDPSDRAMLGALFDGLAAGMRGGPVVVSLTAAADGVERAGGLHDKAAFETVTAILYETARSTGVELELALVEMSGLTAARRAMSPDAAKDADRRMAGLLRANSHGGGAAADLGADRYALVRQRTGEKVETLVQRMVRLLDLGPQHQVQAAAASVSLAGEVNASQALRAIRYSLDNFIRDGMPEPARITLSGPYRVLCGVR